jgi:hypothetical protein
MYIWNFFVLQFLRHEEFEKGCEAACNGLVLFIDNEV